ncbi:RNA polymerase sporulation-specific sigma factor [Sporobacter termitidis DSM 10068]|uniref:RNA polymerase sigma factor n=1 Tax=Sporobacter termitidis DSM 10068 TaxID=1123282 RepID=A0A1M5Z4M2_9FIRM|nr:RNA polymerase sporulation sigma factor SigK [Sporobacter termitidis]SHI19225.1 RNA polymerase sporulation-specific sigma factor [Sporobacter termitidis DSM 10068]
MLSATFAILLMSPFLMLRMSDGAGSFPKPLSAAEEEKYIDLFMRGDMEARNILIERNLRLVAHIIKKYYTLTSEQDDLISIGTIGLIKGISTYKPERRVRLATYASRCIENEILMYFRSLKKTAGDLSLSDSIDTDKDGNSLSLMEVISVEDDMLDNLSARETCGQLCQYIGETLSDREAEIITMRYGLDNSTPKTQREIAAICGISRSYVSRIEKKALEKLRKCFEDSYL